MGKVIYEYYYVVGRSDFETWYEYKVDRETEKMYYGTAFKLGTTDIHTYNFATKKSNLNVIDKIKDRKYGLVYRIKIAKENEQQAREKARQIIYDYIVSFAEKLKNHMED